MEKYRYLTTDLLKEPMTFVFEPHIDRRTRAYLPDWEKMWYGSANQ